MFEINLRISRPPAEVFAALARIEDAPLWYSAVTRVDRLDAGPISRGARARFTRQLGGSTVENEVEVSEFEPGERFALSSVSGPTPLAYRYRLTPANGGTLLQLQGQISAAGLPGPLAFAGPLAEAFFKRGLVANLRTLKRLIENR